MMFNNGMKQQHLSKQKPAQMSRLLYFANDLSLEFGKLQALRNVQLEIHPGEMVFITGASGAGKTSLLNILSGSLRPTGGTIQLPQNVFVSRVFQDLKLVSNKTIEENLFQSFDKKAYQSKNEFYRDLTELCKLLGFFDRIGEKLEFANGGLKQKVAIVRALLAKPDVILADEPTCSMDKENAQRVYELFEFFNKKRGTTIIWASHNRELVKHFSGRNIHLDRGKLVYSGHACFI